MKEELTREEIKRFILFAKDRDTRKLATALLEEMDKPKVWDGAPDIAVRGIVNFYSSGGSYIAHKTYTRELQKTRARQIAEEIEEALSSSPRYKSEVEIIETALERYAAELKGEE